MSKRFVKSFSRTFCTKMYGRLRCSDLSGKYTVFWCIRPSPTVPAYPRHAVICQYFFPVFLALFRQFCFCNSNGNLSSFFQFIPVFFLICTGRGCYNIYLSAIFLNILNVLDVHYFYFINILFYHTCIFGTCM